MNKLFDLFSFTPDDWKDVCSSFWLISIVFYLTVNMIDSTKHLVSYGKKLVRSNQQEQTSTSGMVTNGFLFTSSYCLGVLTLVLLAFFRLLPNNQYALYWNVVFLVHLWRRIYECVCIHRFSVKLVEFYKVPLAWLFYIMVILSMNLALKDENEPLHYLFVPLSLFVFLVGSISQHKCHLILASTRTNGSSDYVIPQGYLFELVSCPHYLSEIAIYLSFVLLYPRTWIPMSIFAFVCTNLVATALESHTWYKDTFPKYPGERTAILPYLI